MDGRHKGSQAPLQVRYLVIRYVYSYRGCEVWKGGRLLRLDSTSNDNGKRYVVSAVAKGQGVRVRVNNQEWMARADTWLTSYWCLPPGHSASRPSRWWTRTPAGTWGPTAFSMWPPSHVSSMARCRTSTTTA